MRNRASRARCLLLSLFLGLTSALPREASGQPDAAASPYRRYFVYSVDRRSLSERTLNLLGITSEEVGRSFALIAGVSRYPNLPAGQRNLQAAKTDLTHMVTYLRDFEFFDEIVILENEAVTLENFRYFLQVYFPDRLKAFPKSRFLFVYSGHGMQDGERGYLLQASARNFADKEQRISMKVLQAMYDEIVGAAYHSLALINACHSGNFGRRTFGMQRLLPDQPGAHVITAGGTKELAWHIDSEGPGSVFFEKFFAGLSGRADVFPEQRGRRGDGVVTVPELYSYLAEHVKIATDQAQNPQLGDFSRNGSLGSFFFLNRDRQARAGIVGDWTLRRESMGAEPEYSEIGQEHFPVIGIDKQSPIVSYPPPPAPPKPIDVLQSSDMQEVNDEFRRRGFTHEVYFQHNDSALSDYAREKLARNAEFLRSFSEFLLTIEGHASAEGTPEVNLAMGSQRANSVMHFLSSLGIDVSRLRTITYGAERPLCNSFELSCATQNRRVRMIITGRR